MWQMRQSLVASRATNGANVAREANQSSLTSGSNGSNGSSGTSGTNRAGKTKNNHIMQRRKVGQAGQAYSVRRPRQVRWSRQVRASEARRASEAKARQKRGKNRAHNELRKLSRWDVEGKLAQESRARHLAKYVSRRTCHKPSHLP